MIRVLLIDDHEVFLDGLSSIFTRSGKVEVVGIATTMGDAYRLAPVVSPDLIVMDLNMPDSKGVGEIASIRAAAPEAVLAVLTGFGSRSRKDALDSGARLFFTKDASAKEILNRILDFFGRKEEPDLISTLTEREKEVAKLAATGCSNPEIAEILGLTLNTVKWHLKSVMMKLEVHDRVSLANVWQHQNP
jgi:DNA-binding NarL/FixJ family response regulator